MIGGYFSPDDRQRIAEMRAAYQPVAVIACALMVDPSTIHRELKLGNEDGELDTNRRLSTTQTSHNTVSTRTCVNAAGKRRPPHECNCSNSASSATTWL